MLFITSLNSGSNGNCYYIGNSKEAILVDAGISCLETERRMARLGLSMNKVKAIFISHEHTDHVKGLAGLVKKYPVKVFVSQPTFLSGATGLVPAQVNFFKSQQEFSIGDLSIVGFRKFHDACDPHSFMISSGPICVGVFTDIGRCCDQVIQYFRLCHAAFLESNYDDALLENGRYPWFLKNRIRGGSGHLSNQQALEIFRKHKPAFMSYLLLSHLSADNNCPSLVQQLFLQHAGKTKIVVAGRQKETPVFTIGIKKERKSYAPANLKQLQLWDI